MAYGWTQDGASSDEEVVGWPFLPCDWPDFLPLAST